MTISTDTINTAYGHLNEQVLTEIRRSFDPRRLLRSIEEYDQALAYLGSEKGPRDSLVRLWCIAANLISGATPVLRSSESELEPLLGDVRKDLEDAVAFFQSCINLIEPLSQLPATIE